MQKYFKHAVLLLAVMWFGVERWVSVMKIENCTTTGRDKVKGSERKREGREKKTQLTKTHAGKSIVFSDNEIGCCHYHLECNEWNNNSPLEMNPMPSNNGGWMCARGKYKWKKVWKKWHSHFALVEVRLVPRPPWKLFNISLFIKNSRIKYGNKM